MPHVFMFADEAGDFNFSRHQKASRYFIVCTVAMKTCEIAHELLALRRDLAWRGKEVGDYFHATTDKQEIRDAVFNVIQNHPFEVHAQIMEKSKAQPHVRATEERFYKHGWLYLLRHGPSKAITPGSEVMITVAAIATAKKRRAFAEAVQDVANQTMGRTEWRTHVCACQTDPCLQIADYCTWAIQRKWERQDKRSYDLISGRVRYEYDLWAHGTQHYY